MSINWADYVKLALGTMQIRPDDFWNMSMPEFYMALQGFKNFHAATEKEEPMSKDRLDELMELYPD